MKAFNLILIISIIFAFCIFTMIVSADDTNTSGTENLTADNSTEMAEGVEYPQNETEITEGLDYEISTKDYADVGGISTGFSGSSVEGMGNNQSPSAVMSFSDKSMVSGFIKNFMKSFHYESGIDV